MTLTPAQQAAADSGVTALDTDGKLAAEVAELAARMPDGGTTYAEALWANIWVRQLRTAYAPTDSPTIGNSTPAMNEGTLIQFALRHSVDFIAQVTAGAITCANGVLVRV